MPADAFRASRRKPSPRGRRITSIRDRRLITFEIAQALQTAPKYWMRFSGCRYTVTHRRFTAAGRQENRQVEIVVSDEQGRFPSLPTAQFQVRPAGLRPRRIPQQRDCGAPGSAVRTPFCSTPLAGNARLLRCSCMTGARCRKPLEFWLMAEPSMSGPAELSF